MSPLSTLRHFFGKQEIPHCTRVAIIGAGAAGMAAAFALTNHPEKFKVTIYDKQDVCGGMATSTDIDAERFGGSYVNDGVQGGSPQFYNTYKFFEFVGCSSTDVGMQISFGKGKDQFWTNVFPSELISKHRDDIKKFGRVLKVIGMFEPIFAVMSVQAMLKLFMFPKDFGDRLIYPLIALFMGTGNQTPYVSAAILERLFLDPSMSLFEYSEDSLLAQIPTMRAFPSLNNVYENWRKYLEEHGATFKLSTEVTRIIERKKNKVIVAFRNAHDQNAEEDAAIFDEIIFAADADSCLKILGKQATWKERIILGNVKYFWDISVTHYDRDYMSKYYELEYRESFVAKDRRDDPEAKKSLHFAEKNFKPLYFIHMYDQDPKKIEMSFDLTHYQPQFKASEVQNDHTAKSSKDVNEQRWSNRPHVFQTIFLNKDMSDLWTKDEIEPSKIIMEKWWKQQGHNWTHYLKTVPWLWTINGKNYTRYAGGWGLVNMHEVAITSGFAAAYSLGAKYPFSDDPKASRLFSLVLRLFYLKGMRREDKKRTKNS